MRVPTTYAEEIANFGKQGVRDIERQNDLAGNTMGYLVDKTTYVPSKLYKWDAVSKELWRHYKLAKGQRISVLSDRDTKAVTGFSYGGQKYPMGTTPAPGHVVGRGTAALPRASARTPTATAALPSAQPRPRPTAASLLGGVGIGTGAKPATLYTSAPARPLVGRRIPPSGRRLAPEGPRRRVTFEGTSGRGEVIPARPGRTDLPADAPTRDLRKEAAARAGGRYIAPAPGKRLAPDLKVEERLAKMQKPDSKEAQKSFTQAKTMIRRHVKVRNKARDVMSHYITEAEKKRRRLQELTKPGAGIGSTEQVAEMMALRAQLLHIAAQRDAAAQKINRMKKAIGATMIFLRDLTQRTDKGKMTPEAKKLATTGKRKKSKRKFPKWDEAYAEYERSTKKARTDEPAAGAEVTVTTEEEKAAGEEKAPEVTVETGEEKAAEEEKAPDVTSETAALPAGHVLFPGHAAPKV